MPKRKRARDSNEPLINDTEPTAPLKTTLLSLPPEIRSMIWKAALRDLILLSPYQARWGVPPAVRTIALDQNFMKFPCGNYHRSRQQDAVRSLKKGSGVLSWLRTNRQIYAEANPLVYNHVTLHLCNNLAWQVLLSDKGSKLNLQLAKVRSVSFCYRIFIEHDLRDGFTWPKTVLKLSDWHDSIGFTGLTRPVVPRVCQCNFCVLFDEGKTLDQRMPALCTIQPLLSFMCRPGQGNTRPVIGQLQDGRHRKGRLYRPKNPSALILQDDEAALQVMANQISKDVPWRLFRGGHAKTLHVRTYLDAIKHHSGNTCTNPHDVCWCRKRSIDAETFPGALLATALQKELTGANETQ